MEKLLHIIDSLGPGGAERLVVDTINGLPNFEHHLIILNGPETLRPELPAACRFLNLNRQSNKEILRHARAVKQYIHKHQISVVHSHLYFSSVIARLGTPKLVPLLNSIHIISSLDNYSKSRLALLLEKITYKSRHHIIAVSNEALKDFDEWVGIKGPAQVLYNFARDEFYNGDVKTVMGTNPLRLVAVGNLRPQKNYAFLIEAFKQLPPNVNLHIYGEGPLEAELQQQITTHGLNIQLMGCQSALHTKLPGYDAYVMCSFFEGQPLSLLEAIASGLPALLSDIPVLREVTGEHALYFNIESPKEFVTIIEGILEGRIDLLRNIGPARARIAEFANRRVYLEKLSGLYRQKIGAAVPIPPVHA